MPTDPTTPTPEKPSEPEMTAEERIAKLESDAAVWDQHAKDTGSAYTRGIYHGRADGYRNAAVVAREAVRLERERRVEDCRVGHTVERAEDAERKVAEAVEGLTKIAATSRYPDPTDAANESVQTARDLLARLSPAPQEDK